jgi:alkylation response protein AidB-like acyl-CoA dehydrogenase
MYFALTPEQRQLQAELRALLAERQPEARVRALMDEPAGDDPALWADVLRLVGPGDAVRHAVVLEVLGEALYVGPYLSSVVRAGSLLPEAATGEVRATFTGGEGPPEYADGRVTGKAVTVFDAMAAQRLLVLVSAGGELAIASVDASGAGVARSPQPGLDQTRKLGNVQLDGAPAQLLAVPDVGAALDRMRMVTLAGVAAEQVGCAQAALVATLSYVRERQQFGRAVGSYQAIKHALADVALAVEQARAAAYHAAWTLDARPDEAGAAVSHARIVCTQAAIEASEASMQFRGGQGFRWDNAAHLYLKRAKSSQLLFGDVSVDRARIAELLDLV